MPQLSAKQDAANKASEIYAAHQTNLVVVLSNGYELTMAIADVDFRTEIHHRSYRVYLTCRADKRGLLKDSVAEVAMFFVEDIVLHVAPQVLFMQAEARL